METNLHRPDVDCSGVDVSQVVQLLVGQANLPHPEEKYVLISLDFQDLSPEVSTFLNEPASSSPSLQLTGRADCPA